jgi:hypothetical protein
VVLTVLRGSRRLRRIVAASALVMLSASAASAQDFFDMLFGGGRQKPSAPQASSFADPFGMFQPPSAPKPAPVNFARSSGFCVRLCDGKYFPIVARGGATPAQMCQAFCPASPTRVFFGSSIEGASGANGERYADLGNAFAYRKAMSADCTCNGRDPAGLAPVDLSLDTTLRPGDVVATNSGLVAYTGVRLGQSQEPDFTPVSSYPGLTADVRARLGELKVAPVAADAADDARSFENARAAMVTGQKAADTKAARGRRTAVD